MTAGQQGGSWGSPGEQQGSGGTPGYQPAPPSPGSGWPPAPPGWGPAPGAPVPPPPPAMERPGTVRAGLGAIIAGLILSLVGIVYQAVNFDALYADTLAAVRESQSGSTPSADSVHAVLIGALVFAIVWLCLQALFVWFAWQGRNWARIVLWVIAGLGVAGGLLSMLSSSYVAGFLRTLSVFEWLLVVAAIVLLALKPSNEWYRYRRWLRDTGHKG